MQILYRVSQNLSQTFPRYSPPSLKQKSSYQHGSKSDQVPRYRLTFMCWYPFDKMFKVLTICRNTSVETSHLVFLMRSSLPGRFLMVSNVATGKMSRVSRSKNFRYVGTVNRSGKRTGPISLSPTIPAQTFIENGV
jgi:hypothetical protein